MAAEPEFVDSGEYAQQWDPTEYGQLAVAATAKADPLAAVPDGALLAPRRPLSIEQVLNANRSEMTVEYAETPADAVKHGRLNPGDIQIDSPNYVDYDEERRFVYATGRPVVRYGVFVLTADRVLVDTRLREIQAYGNVELTTENESVEAESMWVNTVTGEGVAYHARGRTGNFYFLGDPTCGDGTTTFQQLSRDESHFKNVSLTTCDFPVPHFRVQAKELSVLSGDRIFARNVVVYVHEVPVLWLPYFVRSLKDANPWGVSIGSDSSLGSFVRVFYDYYNSCYVPADADPDTMVRKSFQHARLRGDYFSKRGFGEGLEYSYEFDQGRHRGNLDAYLLNSDDERSVRNEDQSSRYYINWFHRTRITEDLSWLVDTDWISDPELFYDVFDRLRGSGDIKRDRLPERQASTGIEWTTDSFFAGLQVSIKDRIGRDRLTDYAEPKDNDKDYDRGYNDEDFIYLTPPAILGGTPIDYNGIYTNPLSVQSENLDNGLSTKRYGRVSEKLPQVTLSTNRLQIGLLPLWYHADLNLFNNLDKGLNTVGKDDDSYVQGFDLYQSISHLLKWCDRYTLLSKAGVGFGVAERDDDSLNLDFPDNATFPFVYDGQKYGNIITGLVFTDPETFLVGTKKYSLKDVDPAFAYGDFESRFNARITDALNGWVRYRVREGTGNNLGQFYENIGNTKAKDDLYAFRTDEHWLEGGLIYTLLFPRLTANASVGTNLQGSDKITPNEVLQYSNLGVGWSNMKNTLFINSGVGLNRIQMRDKTDPNEFEQEAFTYYLSGSYMPVHRRFYARTSAYMVQNARQDPRGDQGGEPNYDAQRNDTSLNATVGKKIGTKYAVEVYANTSTNNQEGDSIQDLAVRIKRDFHDLIGTVAVGTRSNQLSNDDSGTNNDFQVRFNVQFKRPGQTGVPPYSRTTDLYTRSKLGAFETGG